MTRRSAMGTYCALGALMLLLIAELVFPYDVIARRLALASTNVFGIAMLSWFLFGTDVRNDQSGLQWVVAWSVTLGIAFDAFGNFFLLYGRFPWWDKVAHGVGSAAAGLALFLFVHYLRTHGNRVFGDGVAAFLAVGTATTLSVVYEVVEYLGDLAFNTHRVTDPFDTADDLLWDVLAIAFVTLFALWITRLSESRKRSTTV